MNSNPVIIEVMLVGATVALAILLRGWLPKIRVPALAGYIALGFLINLGGARWGFFTAETSGIFELFAQLGLIVLLFRVGLESKISGLKFQLKNASLIWSANIFFSGALGYAFAKYLLGLAPLPSLFVGTALTATSVGVSIAAWRESGVKRGASGDLLLDVAELDDISGVLLMSVLFAVAPVIRAGDDGLLLVTAGKTAGGLLLKALLFGALCILFAKYLEKPILDYFRGKERAPEPMLVLSGIGFMIAAVAGWLGFSLAVGALFAGLVFSRDPRSLKIDRSFGAIYEMFMPFFFVGIGLKVELGSVAAGLGLGAAILVVAVLGKLLGTVLPAVFTSGWTVALLLGVSMVPRAEIALVIMQQGLDLGGWAVSPEVYSSMVFVSIATCILAPLVLQNLLRMSAGEGGAAS
ncbi:MAG: cation:proton antiporter [Nitrospirota bacterium]|jgi:Kef-type K+ transport system membrane component KefB